MRVALLFTRWVNPPYGGWYSYAVHLARGLKAAGAEVQVLCAHSGRTPVTDLGGGVWMRHVAPKALRAELAKYDVAHVVCLSLEEKSAPDVLSALRGTRATCTVHDPTELAPRAKAAREWLADRERGPGPVAVVAIREVMREYLAARVVAPVHYVPHPYAFADYRASAPREALAVATSRVDWDKHTDVILQARPTSCRVEFWTASVNRIYAYQRLRELGWPTGQYRGGFGKRPADLAAVYGRAKVLVDMSAIAADGGGTQYTFLEATDHGCALVLNAKWAIAGSNALRPGEHYVPCSTPAEVAAALDRLCGDERARLKMVRAARAAMSHHDAATVARAYLHLWRTNHVS